ncbi:hypothetical protein Aduo_010017 [Ancylostoma duodenale]
MRFSHALIVALALQVEGCEAGLFDWIVDVWNNHVKPYIVAFGETIAEYATNFWNALKRVANKVYNWFYERTKDKLPVLRKWGTTDWDCGIENFWESKVVSKLLTFTVCESAFGKIRDACKKHRSCYSNRDQCRTTCDSKFCDELEEIRFNYSKDGGCNIPEHFCSVVLYAGPA